MVWATTVGVVVGPNLSDAGGALGRRIGLQVLAGPYVFSVVAFAAAGLRLRPVLAPAFPMLRRGRVGGRRGRPRAAAER